MSGFGILLIVIAVGGVAVALGLRSLVFSEARLEAELHEPGAHSLEFEVPVGADPALARAALKHAGYAAQAELRQGKEILVVACPEEGDRAVVTRIVEGLYGPTAA
jgi:hypothetical protein